MNPSSQIKTQSRLLPTYFCYDFNLAGNRGESQAEFHRQQAEKERAIERAAMIAAGANPDDAAAGEHSIELQQGSGGSPHAASSASPAEPQPLLMPVVSGAAASGPSSL